MIYLVRHGESEANLSRRYSGITDVDLTKTGREQAMKAGMNLKSQAISNIYSSPLKRAFDTAKIISETNQYYKGDIIIKNCLIEVNFGIFENMTWEEMQAAHKAETENWIKEKHKYKFPQGESYSDIIERISEFVDKVPDNSVIVTHFGVIQSMLLYLKIADDYNLWNFIISNCDIMVINNKKFVKTIKCN